MKTLAANELQNRFSQIGLPEELMIELQVTPYEFPWDEAALANRERFLEQGYILVVDRRSPQPRSYLISPLRQHGQLKAPDLETEISL